MVRDTKHHVRRRQFVKVTGGALAVGSTGLAGCIGSDDADPTDTTDDSYENYPEDDIRWIVPHGTGGGFDLYSRFAAEMLPTALPGDGSIVVENISEGGGVRGTETLYRADGDGYTLGIQNIPGMIVAQLFQDVDYDLTEMSWLGTFNSAQYGIMVPTDSPYETLADVQEAEDFSWAMTGPGGTAAMVTFIAAEVLEIDSNFVMGYDGGADARAGILRGETDARMNDFPSAESFVRDGEMRFIVTLSNDPPDWADAPTIADEGYPELADLGLHFMAAAPPGLDPELHTMLADALEEVLGSDEAQEFAADTDRPINYIGPDETRDIAVGSIDLVEEFADILDDHLS